MSEKNPSAVLRTRGIARAVCAAVLTLAAVAPVVARDVNGWFRVDAEGLPVAIEFVERGQGEWVITSLVRK